MGNYVNCPPANEYLRIMSDATIVQAETYFHWHLIRAFILRLVGRRNGGALLQIVSSAE